MKIAITLVILLALSSCILASNEMEEGYYLGRSGDVVIATRPGSLEVSMQSNWETSEMSLIDTQFHGALARQLGLPYTSLDTTTAQLPLKVDLFAPRRANLLVVVDGVSSEELNLRDVSAAKSIRSSYSPAASPSALLASMLTGATPRQHGIVADKWDYLGETERAYIHAFPQVAQIADILAQQSTGSARIVSASASPVFARALGIRPSLSAYAQNTVMLQYNPHSERITTIGGLMTSPVSSMTPTDLHNLIRTHFRDEVLIETAEHHTLYAELAMLLKSVSDLAIHAQTASSPDLYNFAITALNPIRSIHSEQSSEYTSALALVRKTVNRAIEKIQHAYNDQAIYEVVCFRVHQHINQDIFDRTQVAIADFGVNCAHFPNLYDAPEGTCAVLKDAGIDAYCPFTPAERVQSQTQLLDIAAAGKRATIVGTTPEITVALWHMFMWTWLVLIIIIYVVWYYFYYMDIGEDSLLYRMTAIPAATKKEQ